MSQGFNSSGRRSGVGLYSTAYIIDGTKEKATKTAYAAMYPQGPHPSDVDWNCFFMRLDRSHAMDGHMADQMRIAHQAARALT